MSWAQAEFHDWALGDARRTQRLIKLVDDLSAQPTGSIPLACGGWPETKAAYRLLDNPAVEWREILEVHTTRTVARMAGQPVVLCIQDTTELDFTTPPGMAGLGRLSYEAQHVLYVHPTCTVGLPDEIRTIPARVIRPSDPGSDTGGGSVGGGGCLAVGAKTERPTRR